MTPIRELLQRVEAHFADAFEEGNPFGRNLEFILGGVFVVLLLYGLFFAPPQRSLEPRMFVIERGESLSSVATALHEDGLIRSPLLFKAIAYAMYGDRSIMVGGYYFFKPEGVFTIAARVSSGDFEVQSVKITIPEGSTVQEIADILDAKLGVFDREGFLRAAQGKEGYLFPDTYFFLPGQDPVVVEKAMEDNFTLHIAPLREQISAFGKPLRDVVIMASLLEEEARTTETRRTIAGILWRRIAIGMRLQVDAVFPYILGKNTYQVTSEDLKIDSPYNTYLYAGLPAGPISNPGVGALTAAITPIKTPYLYYLSDAQGVMHYSATHEGHVANKQKYLK